MDVSTDFPDHKVKAAKIRLVAPLLEVVMADGSTWEVQAVNKDLLLWDRTRIKQRPIWPPMDESPLWWLTFVAWAASKREHLTDLEYEPFEDVCLSVRNATEDAKAAQDDQPGDPTQPGPEPG